MHKVLKRYVGPAGLLCVLLSACALQPQTLPITPRLELGDASLRGNGRTLALDVIDGRRDNVVGYRDQADTNSAITTAPEAMPVIKRALEQGYTKLGFRVVGQGEDADITLEVRLTELGYLRQSGTVVENVTTGATVEATSIMRSKSVTGTYRDSQGRESVLTPNLAENAEIMNKHLGSALARLVADPRLTTE